MASIGDRSALDDLHNETPHLIEQLDLIPETVRDSFLAEPSYDYFDS